jgi:hypothetical protein
MKESVNALIAESKTEMEVLEYKLEKSGIRLSDESSQVWTELKKNLAQVYSKLNDAASAYKDKAEEKIYLMEAKHKIAEFQNIAKNFMASILASSAKDVDIVKYKTALEGLKAKYKLDEIK